MNTKILGFCNEKGGVGKSSSAAAIAYLLAKQGKRTLLADFDGQSHATLLCGVQNANSIPITIDTLLKKVMLDEPLPEPESYIIHKGALDLLPANSQLCTLERNLCNVDFRERVLKTYIDTIKDRYEYIIFDCAPQLGTPLMNVLMCADSVIIPTQAEILSAMGLTQLIKHCEAVKRNTGHSLKIEGILITMYDQRTTLSTEVTDMIQASCGKQVRIFNAKIPRAVKVGKAALHCQNICEYAPTSPAALAYEAFVKELTDHE